MNKSWLIICLYILVLGIVLLWFGYTEQYVPAEEWTVNSSYLSTENQTFNLLFGWLFLIISGIGFTLSVKEKDST